MPLPRLNYGFVLVSRASIVNVWLAVVANLAPDVLSVTNLTSNVPSPLLTTDAPVNAGFATNVVSGQTK